MALHISKNGVATVTPDHLYHPNGVVSDPQQRAGIIPHGPDGNGNHVGHQQGHGFIGADRSVIKTRQQA